jgi:puromycin-sensitive aminopeptidase
VIAGRLRFVARFLGPDERERFGAVVADLLRPVARDLGWEPREGESGRDHELRAVVLDALGTVADDQETIARAREVHDQSLANRADVDPDVVAACVSIVSHHGNDDDFDRFVERFRQAETPQEQLRYLYSLGQFPTEALVQRALDLATSNEVRTQSAPFLLQRAIRNRDHGSYAWAFVRDHWDTFAERFPPNLVVRMVEGVQWLLDDDTARDVEQFLDAHPFAQGERTIRQHVERLQVHVAARRREAARLAASL